MPLFRRVVKVAKIGNVGKVVRVRDGRAGQAALEFLLTYGWAILAVLVVLGGLVRFGVLNPSNLLPEKCSFPGSVGCPDFDVGSNGIKLVLQNRAGKDIVVSGVSFGSDALSQSSGACSTGAMSAVVNNGAKATFYANDPFNCAFKDIGRPKNKYNITIAYSFLTSPSISHSLSGELLARKGEGAVSWGAGEYGGGVTDPALVGYWHLDAQGTYADSSGQGNTLTPIGSVTSTTGRIKEAVLFDGVGAYLRLTPIPNAIKVKDFTFAFWVNDMWNAPEGIVGYESGNNHAFKLYANSANGQYTFGLGNGTALGTNNGCQLNAYRNMWVHCALVWDATNLASKVYVNGALQGSFSYASQFAGGTVPNWSRTQWFLGAATNGGAFLKGSLDEVALYNRTLTAQEIAALAAQ